MVVTVFFWMSGSYSFLFEVVMMVVVGTVQGVGGGVLWRDNV